MDINSQLKKKEAFDEEVDSLYSKFLDIIEEYEIETKKSKQLDKKLSDIQNKKTSEIKKRKNLKNLKFDEIEAKQKFLEGENSKSELDEKIKVEIEKSVDLVNQIEGRRLRNWKRKKESSQPFK